METYESQAKQLQALAHPARLQILELLSHGPVCVCDLVMMTGKRQPYISQQLAFLREVGLVNAERQGWSIFYQTNHSKLAELQAIISHISQTEGTHIK